MGAWAFPRSSFPYLPHSIWPATSGGGDTPGASLSCYVLPRAPAGILLTFGLLGLRTPGGSDAYCVMRIGRGMTNTQYAEALDPLIAEIVVVMGCFHHQAMYVVTPRMRGQVVEWCGENKFG